MKDMLLLSELVKDLTKLNLKLDKAIKESEHGYMVSDWFEFLKERHMDDIMEAIRRMEMLQKEQIQDA